MSRKHQTIKSFTVGLILIVGLSLLTGCLRTLPMKDASTSMGTSPSRCSGASQSKDTMTPRKGCGAGAMKDADANTKDTSTPRKGCGSRGGKKKEENLTPSTP